MVAPGTALREGIDNILHARTGGLLVVGEVEDLSFLFSGGIKLDVDYTPPLLFQLAKMDGAIVLNANATKIATANTDRKSTRLNSSHANISYAVFCLKNKN